MRALRRRKPRYVQINFPDTYQTHVRRVVHNEQKLIKQIRKKSVFKKKKNSKFGNINLYAKLRE